MEQDIFKLPDNKEIEIAVEYLQKKHWLHHYTPSSIFSDKKRKVLYKNLTNACQLENSFALFFSKITATFLSRPRITLNVFFGDPKGRLSFFELLPKEVDAVLRVSATKRSVQAMVNGQLALFREEANGYNELVTPTIKVFDSLDWNNSVEKKELLVEETNSYMNELRSFCDILTGDRTKDFSPNLNLNEILSS